MSRKSQVNKSLRQPLLMGQTYYNEEGHSRVVERIKIEKSPCESNKIVFWKGSNNEEGVSGSAVFYDWMEGNYDDGSRRRRKR